MDTAPNPNPTSADDAAPHWTLDRMQAFITTLRRTRSVAAAARAAGMSRQAAYRLRARLRGHPFDRAWTAAMAPRAAMRRVVADWAAGDAGLHRVSDGDICPKDPVNFVNFVNFAPRPVSPLARLARCG
jgi:hypothetical protein